MTAPSLSWFTAGDGTSLAYRVRPASSATPSAPALVLVHSLAMDHRFWDPVAAQLAGAVTLITLDARGHGRSGRGPHLADAGAAAATTATPYAAQRMADDVRDLLDHLGIARAHVGGASMGGCVALQFAGTHPTRTAGLALIDTTAWYGPTAPQDWEERAQKAVQGGLGALVDFQKTRWFSDAFRARAPQVVDECIATFLANDLAAYVATCRMLGAFDGRALLPLIRVPVCILVGEEDYAAPVAMAEALRAGLADARLTVIPGTRHLTPLEVSELVAAQLRALCTGVRP